MSNWKAFRDAITATGEDVLMLLDKNMEPVADLRGAIEWKAPRKLNETGVAEFVIPADHPAADVVLFNHIPADDTSGWFSLLHEAHWIIAEDQYERDIYRVARITDSPGSGTLKIEAKSLWRWLEKIALWASPGDPLIAQLKYRDLRAGDSLRVIKQFLLVNLMREFQPGGVQGWDMWARESWYGVNADLWPAIVNPVNASTTTAFTVLDARFDMAGEMFKETLDAAGLMVTADLWLEGDPQPFPLYVTLYKPTIIFDVKPRQFDTAATNTPLEMLRGFVRTFDTQANAPRIGLGATPATAAGRLPWVVWRPEDMAEVSADFTVVKSEDSHVIVGGRSPEALNKLVAGGAKAIFQGLAAGLAGAFPPFAPLIAAAGVFLGELVGASMQDKLFAWMSFSDALRRAAHGRFTYRTQVGSGDGWTLSGWQQGFQMLQAGAGSIQIGFSVDDQSAYSQGRDYSLGDQAGFIHRGKVFATYISETVRGVEASGARIQSVTLGDPRARESAIANLNRTAKSISNAVSRAKSFVM